MTLDRRGSGWRPRSLRSQLLIYGAVSVLLAVVVTAVLNLRFADAEAHRRMEAQALDTAAALAAALEWADPIQAQRILVEFQESVGPDSEYHAQVVNAAGSVVAATDPALIDRPIEEALDHPEPELQRVLAGDLPVASRRMTHAGLPVLDVSLPLRGDRADRSRITGGLHLSVSYRALTSTVWALFVTSGLSTLLLAVLLIAPLWLYLEPSLLRPMRILTAAHRAVAASRAEGRLIPLAVMPPHELGEVMRTWNEMQARLEAAEAELQRRLRELSTLTGAAALLSDSASVDVLMGRVLEKALEITGDDAGEVSLFDPATKRLVVRAHRGFSADWLAGEVDRPVTCLCGQVVQRREPVCLSDANGDPRVERSACVRDGFRSFCAVPLEAEGLLLGVMSLHGRQARQHSAGEIDLLAAIGNQVAVALQNVMLYEETRRLAITDSLTGLTNRRHFMERSEREFERARRYRRPLSAIMLDIDHFKHVNDTHGHAAGDQVLRAVAQRCRDTLREIDLMGRYGGEEFAALLPENGLTNAHDAAERLRRCVADAPIETDWGPMAITISLGVSALTGECPDLATLLDWADAAMYAAKDAGRNRVEVMRTESQTSSALSPTSGGQ